MKLFDIPAEFDAISTELEMCEGEITPELEQRMRDALEGGTEKLESAAYVVKSLEANAKFLKDESDRLAGRATAQANNADRLKALMLSVVDAAFNGKCKTPKFSIWGQTSADGVTIELAPDADIAKLPESFVRIPAPELNRKALQDAYKAGESLPDAIVITPRPGTRYLRIR